MNAAGSHLRVGGHWGVALAEALLAGRFLGGSLTRAAKVLVLASSPPFFPTWAHSYLVTPQSPPPLFLYRVFPERVRAAGTPASALNP